MTELHARCDACPAEFDLRPTQVVVALPDRTRPEVQPEVLYGCPECGRQNVRLLPRVAALVVIQHGAAALPLLSVPVVPYPERRPEVAEPLAVDDLLALHELLEQPHWFAELVGRVDEDD